MKNHTIKQVLGAAVLVTFLVALTQTASAHITSNGPAVPDAGSTSALMGMACAALAVVRRKMR